MLNSEKRIKILCFAMLVFIISTNVNAQKKVFGYYPNWVETGANSLATDKIKYDKLTHVIHAFIYPDSTGALMGTEDLLQSDLVSEAHKNDVNVLVSIGGAAGEEVNPSKWFNTVAEDDSTREIFVNNVMQFITENNYDGIDLDWEQPADINEGKNLTKLAKAFKDKFSEINKPLVLTMATFPSESFHSLFEYDKLADEIDYFLVMAYNYSGSWLEYTGHNTPLYTASGYESNGSIDETLKRLMQLGIPKEKLVLGSALYGYEYNASELRGEYTGAISLLLYHQIDLILKNGNWEIKWDDESKNTYAVDVQNNKYITFDDTTAVKHKAEYIINNGFAGMMIWALGYDLLLDGSQPLVNAIGNVYTSVVENNEAYKELKGYKLYHNYPNPFNPLTKITFEVPEKSFVEIKIFNSTGEEVRKLFSGEVEAGHYERIFDGSLLASGVYYYKLTSGDFSISKRMILLK